MAGCASTKFSIVGENQYQLARISNGCAAGNPTAVLDQLRDESVKFCAGRKEVPVEIASSTEYGIPVVRCASATLTFSCKP